MRTITRARSAVSAPYTSFEEPELMRSSPPTRSAWTRGVLAAAVVAGAFALLTPLRGGGRAYYVVAPEAVAAVAAQVIAWRTLGRHAALGVAGGGLVFAGLLLIFSLGLPFLFFGLVVLVLAAGAALRRGAGALLNVAGGAALALAVGVVLFLAVLRPPVVGCGVGGSVSSSSPSWWGGGATSAGGSGTRERTSGMIRQGDVTITFTCEEGRLIDLRTERSPDIR